MKEEKKLTSLQKLIDKRKEVEEKCLLQEQMINEDFIFIHEHSLGLLGTGLVTLFFPKRKHNSIPEESKISKKNPFDIDNILSFMDRLYPMLWQIAEPILTAWSIQKIQRWLSNKIFNSKDNSNN